MNFRDNVFFYSHILKKSEEFTCILEVITGILSKKAVSVAYC